MALLIGLLITGSSGVSAEAFGHHSNETQTASVWVPNQTLDDQSLTVGHVVVPDGGYILVHGSRYVFDGIESPIGVSAYLPPGTYYGVRVPLTNGSVTNRTRGTFAAVVHHDDGDQEFEYVDDRSVDQPYRVDGGLVADTTRVEASERRTRQPPNRTVASPTTSRTTARTSTPTTTPPTTERGSSLNQFDRVGLIVGGVLVSLAVVVFGIAVRPR